MRTSDLNPTQIKAERLQTRAATSSEYIDELAERMTAGDVFPPIVLFSDGKESWLADGIHRLDAAIKAKKKIGVQQRRGTRAEAVEFACGSNIAHGLRPTNADKRRRISLALTEFPDRSSRAIADLCGVSNHLVEEIRQAKLGTEARKENNSQPAQTTASGGRTPIERRIGKDGKSQAASKRTSLRPSENGKAEAPEPAEPEPVDPNSLEAVQADLRDFEKQLRNLAITARRILRCEGNDIKRPYCGCYSVLTLIHPLQHVARTVANDLPVGGTPKKPKLYHEEKAESVAS